MEFVFDLVIEGDLVENFGVVLGLCEGIGSIFVMLVDGGMGSVVDMFFKLEVSVGVLVFL